MVSSAPLVFVFHPRVGVTRIPQAYMDAYEASGFRYATDAQIAQWCDEHNEPHLRPRGHRPSSRRA